MQVHIPAPDTGCTCGMSGCRRSILTLFRVLPSDSLLGVLQLILQSIWFWMHCLDMMYEGSTLSRGHWMQRLQCPHSSKSSIHILEDSICMLEMGGDMVLSTILPGPIGPISSKMLPRCFWPKESIYLWYSGLNHPCGPRHLYCYLTALLSVISPRRWMSTWKAATGS